MAVCSHSCIVLVQFALPSLDIWLWRADLGYLYIGTGHESGISINIEFVRYCFVRRQAHDSELLLCSEPLRMLTDVGSFM